MTSLGCGTASLPPVRCCVTVKLAAKIAVESGRLSLSMPDFPVRHTSRCDWSYHLACVPRRRELECTARGAPLVARFVPVRKLRPVLIVNVSLDSFDRKADNARTRLDGDALTRQNVLP